MNFNLQGYFQIQTGYIFNAFLILFNLIKTVNEFVCLFNSRKYSPFAMKWMYLIQVCYAMCGIEMCVVFSVYLQGHLCVEKSRLYVIVVYYKILTVEQAVHRTYFFIRKTHKRILAIEGNEQ